MARSISALGKPMLSMFVMAACLWSPRASTDGSLKLAGSVPVAVAVGAAGVGVAGGRFGAEVDAWAGAAGAEGVCEVAGAGVDGALLDEAAAAAGATFGWRMPSAWDILDDERLRECRTFETMHTMKPFSSMLYDSTVFWSCRIFPVCGPQCQSRPSCCVQSKSQKDLPE